MDTVNIPLVKRNYIKRVYSVSFHLFKMKKKKKEQIKLKLKC